jgi:hypothetical protein
VLREFASTDVTYEVFWTVNSSYMSAVGYNATCVIETFKHDLRAMKNVTVRHCCRKNHARCRSDSNATHHPTWLLLRKALGSLHRQVAASLLPVLRSVSVDAQIDENWYLRTHIYPQAAPIIARLPMGLSWGYYVSIEVGERRPLHVLSHAAASVHS